VSTRLPVCSIWASASLTESWPVPTCCQRLCVSRLSSVGLTRRSSLQPARRRTSVRGPTAAAVGARPSRLAPRRPARGKQTARCSSARDSPDRGGRSASRGVTRATPCPVRGRMASRQPSAWRCRRRRASAGSTGGLAAASPNAAGRRSRPRGSPRRRRPARVARCVSGLRDTRHLGTGWTRCVCYVRRLAHVLMVKGYRNPGMAPA